MADPYISSQIASIKGCDANDNKVAMLNDLLNSYPARIYLLAARMLNLSTDSRKPISSESLKSLHVGIGHIHTED